MISRFYHNENVGPLAPVASLSGEPLEFHRRLPGYMPTPLVDTPELARALGVGKVLVKDESSRLGLPSFKILGASWATYRALQQRLGSALRPWSSLDELNEQLEPLRPLTLAAATDGNHGRAVAHVARLLGFGAHIFVPADMAAARMDAIQGEGAQVILVDGSYDDAVRNSAAAAGERTLVISDTSWPGYDDVPRWVIDGYSTIFAEIDEQMRQRGEAQPDLVAVQMGVGALAAAVVGYYRRAEQEQMPRIVGVEPLSAACLLDSMIAGRISEVPGPHASIMAGLNCGVPSEVAWPAVSRGIDFFLAVADERSRQAMRLLAADSVVAGETGAAGVAGLIELLSGEEAPGWRLLLGIDASSTVLAICTEGATDPQAYEAIVGSVHRYKGSDS